MSQQGTTLLPAQNWKTEKFCFEKRAPCYPHGAAGFTGLQNAGVMGSQRLPTRSQEMALAARQCAPEREEHEAVSMKPEMQWRPQKVGEARNMEHLRKATSREQSPRIGHEGCNHQECRGCTSPLEF